MNPFPAMSSKNPVVQILFNHPQNAVLAGGDLSTADSIASVVATRGDFQYRIDILDLGIVLSTAMTRLMAMKEPGRQNGIATIRYTQSISHNIIRSFGEDIDKSDDNSKDNDSEGIDKEIEINTDSVYEVFSSQPLGPHDLRHILRQPPTRTVTTATRTTKRDGRKNKKRKHR
ncbi:hypothetical protein HK102_003952 [Quaeritorhiza haematococci]|nr:hypothetical protein HK102_003952 [Quaeritorhiza haematococci]